jgi:phosphoribosylformimino-5-aminoimidazole carboxamide ribotide isomerase
MVILPAIDLFNGKVVRLTKGSLDNIEVYSEEPLSVALYFKKCGIKNLHIVDLNGAIENNPKNINIVKEIKQATKLKIEFGGGIRDYKLFLKLLNYNLDYLILSTKVILEEEFLNKLIEFKDRIIISLDIIGRDKIAISGWKEYLSLSVFDILKKWNEKGINKFIITDIKRDGTLEGVIDYELLKEIRDFTDAELGYAGGISSIKEVLALKEIGIDKVIIGKALYTHKILIEDLITL